MTSLTPLAQSYIDQFQAHLSKLPGAGSRHVETLRQQGLDAFASLDFPNKRIEEWRFTNLSALTKLSFEPANSDISEIREQAAEFTSDFEMVFIDGIFSKEDSRLKNLPEGITLASLAETLGNGAVFNFDETETRALYALNTAYMQDGFSLHVDDNITIEGTLILTFRNSGGSQTRLHSRNMIILGENAKLTVLERHEGVGTYFSNPVTRISLAKGSTLQHFKLQNESKQAFHLAMVDSEIAEGATYNNFCLSVGGQISRNELKSTILGSDAESHLNGAYLMRGNQHTDTTTLTEHTVPQNISSQVYKGVLDEHAHGVFQGKIHIFEDAQQVAGDQLSKALLLSDFAAVDCKPELEIYADDVKCSHGATSGELDEDALFYMQARGIPEESARKMLIEAFLADVLDVISDEEVKTYFTTLATTWLSSEGDAK